MPTNRWTEADMARAKILYETSDWTIERIGLETRVPGTTLRYHARHNGWIRSPSATSGRRSALSPVTAEPARQVKAAEPPRLMLARLWALMEWYLAEAEQRAKRRGVDIMEREREARFIGVVVKTARDIGALVSNTEKAPRAPEEQSPAGAIAARSLDEIRQDFARRVEELFADRDPAAGAQ